MSPAKHALIWLAALGQCALAAATARAQAVPEARAEAQAPPDAYGGFIHRALQAYDQGRYAEARTLFRRAHELMPTARTLRTIGMCSFNLGDYVDAVAQLEAAATDTRKPLTDEMQAQVAGLIARSNRQIGRFHVRLLPAQANLSVDGRTPTLLNQHELLLEPGRHTIVASASGYRASQSVLNVEGGDRTTLELQLQPEAPDRAPTARSPNELAAARPLDATPAQARPRPADAQGSLQSTLGYVSLGVGAAGLIGFAVVGTLALQTQAKLSDHCPDGRCGPQYHDDVDRYDTLKTASTITLAAGAACALLGGGLLLFRADTEHRRQARLEPVLGLGAIALRGQL